jgi:hypothetical protein
MKSHVILFIDWTKLLRERKKNYKSNTIQNEEANQSFITYYHKNHIKSVFGFQCPTLTCAISDTGTIYRHMITLNYSIFKIYHQYQWNRITHTFLVEKLTPLKQKSTWRRNRDAFRWRGRKARKISRKKWLRNSETYDGRTIIERCVHKQCFILCVFWILMTL